VRAASADEARQDIEKKQKKKKKKKTMSHGESWKGSCASMYMWLTRGASEEVPIGNRREETIKLSWVGLEKRDWFPFL
jgi:hypothetical protein